MSAKRTEMMDPFKAPRAVKTLVIDGLDVSATEDQSILECAREHGIHIPTLCAMEGLSSIGACRLCVVEVEGIHKLLPACVTRVEEGMKVRTRSKKIDAHRRKVVELLFTERNHICAVCVSNGHCELQDLARDLGVNHVTYPYLHPAAHVDLSHDRYGVDHNRCVLCMRCVRVCGEIEGAHCWDVMGRGLDARVITDLNQPWGQSESCTKCGKCVQICPTGALFEKGKSAAEMAKESAFLPYLTSMREVEA